MPTGAIASAIGNAKLTGYLLIVALFEYLGIPSSQITILGILMVIDFATGVGKQFRIDRRNITSHAAWMGAMKKVATILALLSIALMFKGLEIEANGYIKAILGILIMAECYSIIQNVYAIRTGVCLPEFDAISILLKSFGDFIQKRIESTVKTASARPCEPQKQEPQKQE
jgi:phage-related holin